ncbi:LamG domain-containing protein, partial [bacterium]|nr:LamG domain-containing protein [bacterium]
FYRAEKTPSCVFCISDGAKYDVIQPQTPEIKKWTHLAATFDGEIMKLYRNGTLEKSRAARCKANVKNVPIWIGRSQGIGSKPYFNGLISDVRYYNRAISTAEIKDHYESGIECKGPYNF